MSVVDEIKERLDIVDVISEYVPLKKAGRNYKALCPFHSEKTPSFFVFPDTQTWHCFGACSTGGDVFSFVMRYEHITFGEALRLLAKRAGVSLGPKTEAQIAEEKRKERLQSINAAAAAYFHHLLLSSPKGEEARAYLVKRGISQETIEGFQLGYSLDSWEALKKHLTGKGYRLADIHDAGLIVKREDGGYYDRFRGRLMIPIRDERGKTVGFGARALDDSIPKYLNSPQTPLFDKSSLLYGLDMAKEAIRTKGLAVIVEGYMDVLTAHQNGFTNVVASMGTSLTEAQLKRLSRFSSRLALALDADAAGDAATLRGLALARETLARRVVPVPTPRGRIRYEDRLEADIRVITLPPGKDPDEVIKEDPAKWAELVEKALPVVDYYFQVVTSRLDMNSAQGKVAAVRELMPVIQEIGNPVRRTHYLQKLARLVRMDEETLMQGLERRAVQAPEEVPGRELSPPAPGLTFGLEEYCLASFLRKPALLGELDDLFREIGVRELSIEDFVDVENQQIFAALRERMAKGEELDPDSLREGLAEELHSRLDFLLERATEAPPAPEERVEESVIASALRLRKRCLRQRLRELRFLQEDAQESGDSQAEIRYGRLVDAHRDEFKLIERALSARSTRLHFYL